MSEISLSDLIIRISEGLDAVEGELNGATSFHGKRVGALSLAIGKKIGYADAELFCLTGCGILHDNALSEYLLSESNTESAAGNKQTHCMIGQKNAEFFPFPKSIKGFILYHHETANGSGAFGKKQGEYPKEAGIIALADQMDVKFSFQKLSGQTFIDAKAYIMSLAGETFEKDICEIACEILNEDFIASISDETIEQTLRASIPKLVQTISNKDLMQIAGIIARIIDYKSNFTKNHSMQIANKAWYIGIQYGYGTEHLCKLYLAAALHDIGKLFTPIEVLEKPGKLTEEEFEIIKTHVVHSWRILHEIEGFNEIANWASNHHEKLNRSGYPFGKAAEDLDFESRLLTCLDIYQAVREQRPYHPMRTHKMTMEILYHMADDGLIDARITDDIDVYLSALPDGIAPNPVYKNEK